MKVENIYGSLANCRLSDADRNAIYSVLQVASSLTETAVREVLKEQPGEPSRLSVKLNVVMVDNNIMFVGNLQHEGLLLFLDLMRVSISAEIDSRDHSQGLQ